MNLPEPATSPEPVEALCERVRALARRSGEEALRTRQQEAAKLVAESRLRVEAEGQAELLRVRKKLDQQIKRAIQNAHLEARARLARFRWSLQEVVLKEAVHLILQMRNADPVRYRAALDRFLQEARQFLNSPRLIVQVNPQDHASLHQHWSLGGGRTSSDDAPTLLEASDLDAGLRVGTPEWEIVSDQSLGQRRARLDQELRLVIAEVLFGNERDEGPA